jgi:hypothetical protein
VCPEHFEKVFEAPAYSTRVGKAPPQGQHNHQGLHSWHPWPAGQGPEASPNDW